MCFLVYSYHINIAYNSEKSVQFPKSGWDSCSGSVRKICAMISNPRSGWPVLAVQMAQSWAIRCGSGDYQEWCQCQCASYLRGMTSKDGRERSRVING